MRTGASSEKVDASKVKFVLPLKAREKRLFSYDVTTTFGSNVIRTGCDGTFRLNLKQTIRAARGS